MKTYFILLRIGCTLKRYILRKNYETNQRNKFPFRYVVQFTNISLKFQPSLLPNPRSDYCGYIFHVLTSSFFSETRNRP